jgi:hypothetical protein
MRCSVNLLVIGLRDYQKIRLRSFTLDNGGTCPCLVDKPAKDRSTFPVKRLLLRTVTRVSIAGALHRLDDSTCLLVASCEETERASCGSDAIASHSALKAGERSALILLLTLVSLIAASSHADQFTNLFSTQFEVREGYDPKFELIGQNGWVTDSSSYGGNGLLTNYLGTQAAYIGLFPIDPLADSLSLWQPINFAPIAAGMPLITFSVKVSIVDSSTTNRDDFYWSVYNSAGHRLFTLDFFNEDLGIYYVLDDSNNFRYTGLDFSNDVPYQLKMTMNFAHNSWNATLNDSQLLLADQPITTTNAILDLGDVDAVWSMNNSSKPGDNFMIFDDYQITAQSVSTPVAQLSVLGYANGQFSLRVSGTSGARFAIEMSTNWPRWTALKTNVLTDGSFDFIDTQSPVSAKRFYRARWVQ